MQTVFVVFVRVKNGLSWNARAFARFKQLINTEPDFLSIADETAEPRPDMNIKVTAFIVSEKSISMLIDLVVSLW